MASQPGIQLTDQQRAALRGARLTAQKTLEKLAAQIGVSHVALVRYEAGQSRPSIEVLRRWGALLGFEVVELGIVLRKRRK